MTDVRSRTLSSPGSTRTLTSRLTLTKVNPGVMIRLVRIGCAVWDVLAIADQAGRSRWWEELVARTDSAAEQMRAALEIDVPRNSPQARPLGDGIFEFKEPGLRVL